MTIVLTLLGALAFPVVALALLLWLTRLEETLPRDVETARRTPPPPPVLAIPVRTTPTVAPPVRSVELPEQRRPAGRTVGAQAFSRWAEVSRGGSTNR